MTNFEMESFSVILFLVLFYKVLKSCTHLRAIYIYRIFSIRGRWNIIDIIGFEI